MSKSSAGTVQWPNALQPPPDGSTIPLKFQHLTTPDLRNSGNSSRPLSAPPPSNKPIVDVLPSDSIDTPPPVSNFSWQNVIPSPPLQPNVTLPTPETITPAVEGTAPQDPSPPQTSPDHDGLKVGALAAVGATVAAGIFLLIAGFAIIKIKRSRRKVQNEEADLENH